MAQIPLGNFEQPGGAVDVQPSRINNRILEKTLDVGRAQEGLGANIQQVGDGIEQYGVKLASAKAANAHTAYSLQLKAQADQITSGLQDGSVDYTTANDTAQKAFAAIPAPVTPGLPPNMAEAQKGAASNALLQAQLSVQTGILQAKRNDGKNQFSTALALNSKQAETATSIDQVDGYAGMLDPWVAKAQSFGIPSAVASAAVDKTKANMYFNFARGQTIAAQDSIPALQQVQTDLTDPKGAYFQRLDANNRSMLLQEVTSRINTAENKQAAQTEKHENDAVSAVNSLYDAYGSGMLVSAQTVKDAQDAVTGTSQEKNFANVVQFGSEFQKVRTQPFAVQQQWLSQLQAQNASMEHDDPKRDAATVAAATNAVTKNIKLATEDPLQFHANQTNDVVPPLDLTQISKPGGAATVAAQLANRYSILQSQQQQYGAPASLNALHPAESELAGQIFTKLPDAQTKLQMLGALAGSAPSMQAYKDTMKPIVKDDAAALQAGMFQFAGHKDQQGNPVAPMIMKGAAVLKDKNVPMPDEAKFSTAFDSAVGNAYPPGSQERADAFLRFKTIYAGKTDALSTRNSTALDPSLTAHAVSLATGGIATINGGKVVPPYGMPEQDFRDAANASMQRVLAANMSDANRVRDTIANTNLLPMLNPDGTAVPGVYRMAVGRTPMQAPDGHYLWIKVP